jgi:hypothetical protein
LRLEHLDVDDLTNASEVLKEEVRKIARKVQRPGNVHEGDRAGRLDPAVPLAERLEHEHLVVWREDGVDDRIADTVSTGVEKRDRHVDDGAAFGLDHIDLISGALDVRRRPRYYRRRPRD